MTIHLDYREPERRARLQAALLQIAVMCKSACLDDEEDRQKVAEAMTLGVLRFMNEEQIAALRERQVHIEVIQSRIAGMYTPEMERELMGMLTPEQREFFEKLYGSSTYGKPSESKPSSPAPRGTGFWAEPDEGDAP
jgi:hypothetical protein